MEGMDVSSRERYGSRMRAGPTATHRKPTPQTTKSPAPVSHGAGLPTLAGLRGGQPFLGGHVPLTFPVRPGEHGDTADEDGPIVSRFGQDEHRSTPFHAKSSRWLYATMKPMATTTAPMTCAG